MGLESIQLIGLRSKGEDHYHYNLSHNSFDRWAPGPIHIKKLVNSMSLCYFVVHETGAFHVGGCAVGRAIVQQLLGSH